VSCVVECQPPLELAYFCLAHGERTLERDRVGGAVTDLVVGCPSDAASRRVGRAGS
jgi:hypothetical protein